MPYKKKSAVEKSPAKKSKASLEIYKKSTVCALLPTKNSSDKFRLVKVYFFYKILINR